MAYLIMVHHKPRQFEWLMNALYTPEDLFLVHLDAKSLLGIKRARRGMLAEVRRVIAGRPNVRLLRPRFTNWGGWSLSRLLVDAIRVALECDPRWTHFVNLSGQCYPLRPLREVRERLDALNGQPCVQMRPFSELPADDWHLRWHPMLETPVRALVLPGRKPPPTEFRLEYKGSQWAILPRAFCEWALGSEELERISRYLKGLLLSDELILQALVANGPYAERVAAHYGREIVFPGPKVMTIADRDLLRRSPALIARKFDVERDGEILHEIAARCGFRPGPRA